MAGSLLPGEQNPPPGHMAEAAAFLFEAAAQREPGEPSILIRTAHEGRRFMRVAVVNDDMPFLVDSVAMAIAAQGLAIDLLVHPIVAAARNAEGELLALPDAEDAAPRESMIYLETARVDAKDRRALERAIAAALGDVRAAVQDWAKMRGLMAADAERIDDAEGAELLHWLGGGMLTQLGHVTRFRDGSRSQLLGICRKSARELLADDTYERAFAWFDRQAGARPGRAPLIIKANRLSKVHRRVPLDLFIVPIVDAGKVTALSIHAGVWTSTALLTPPDEVPVLRRQLAAMMELFDFPPASHDGKALLHALTTLPHDLVIGFADRDIARVATAMMALGDRPRPRAALVMAPLARHLFAFVWLPRDMLSTQVRMQIQHMLEDETEADTLDWSLVVEGGNLAMLRYVLDFRGHEHSPDETTIDDRLQHMLRGWSEAVEAELEGYESGRAAALVARFAEGFPQGYRTTYGPAEAARDIARIHHLTPGDADRPLGRDARLYRIESDDPCKLGLKIYQLGPSMPLSDAVPALENFGFRVLSEVPTELGNGERYTIHDFRLLLPRREEVEAVFERESAIEAAIGAVLNGIAEDDVFNRLVIATGLDEREAGWMRALYRYLRQSAIAYTIYTVVDAMRGAPAVTRGLVELFRAHHDPGFKGDRAGTIAAADAAIRSGLAGVESINHDRLLRLVWRTIAAILRTNAFAPAAREALAFKFDSALVPGLPKPVPWREIWVYSRRVEGIHLRAGPVARGGLRWSDRRDDFRTEILGLMKAQRVKNAVIVPTGAKGGFYPKQLPDPADDRDAWFAEGRASYEVFIRTLLSVTDNIEGKKVVHPECVVVRDGDDPYFVVAADKGTATFSDVANAIAIQRGFWLGDAFASGGSKGYDHKAMGITARGAWISVQRHFLEMGVDVQADPIRVVGCGDMSGDVFGNGMLLSKTIELVAAFDHRHIFIDPDPDPAASWEERKRLFELPRSSWADYDEKLISKGGGVYARSAKTIVISKEAAAALGTATREFDPESLINAILKSPVDLLWFGGIGTYVRADGESDLQVGDPSNDGLRAAASEVRAKVIGEGANLGITQAGRIAFALKGGRINTDFIDNSAGVDCSDNEVNIKIALATAKAAGKLTEARRIALLAEMTEQVAALVLEDNRLQALALSIAERGGARAVASQTRLIETLEDIGELDRKTEGLADGETLARRSADGMGLTRPELAVLLSNAKLVLQDALEDCALTQDSAIEPLLLSDFPETMREPFRRQILNHRLRPELVATVVANRIVNRMGMIHPFELAEEEGAGLDRVGASFVSASALLGLDEVWAALDTAKMPETARLMLFDQTAHALRSHMADLLRARGTELAPAQTIAELKKGVAELGDHVDELLAEDTRDHATKIELDLIAAGAPERSAKLVARLFAMDGAIGLACLARDSGLPATQLAHSFVDLGARLGLDWAQSVAAVMNPSDPWERLLVAGLARDFQQMRFDFLRALARRKSAKDDISTLIAAWAERNAREIGQFRSMIARAQSAAPVAPAMLAQIASQARNVLQR
ncbi:NAD-glutamate dehydrogenase [Croceibacterium aestuarii]|uniref:NAD-glutamate dehydrogenase n=1 Tax=Croceibacterium aestuarii TaxID=3064139 RepID=UPI00272ED106|nr:NAD-glutamate dehydrogenase domain-containing protein [Croceibacterium sp. D39]